MLFFCRFAYGLGVCIYLFLLPGSCETFEVPLSVTVSLLGLLALCAVVIICNIIIAILSSRGSLTRHRPREKVIVFVYSRTIFFVVELGWLVFSTYAAVSAYLSVDMDTVMGVASGSGQGVVSGGHVNSDCSVILLFCVSVGLAWVLCLLIVALSMCVLDPCGCFLATRYIKHLINSHKYGEEEHDRLLQRSLSDYDRHDRVKGRHSNHVGSALWWSKFRQTFCFCFRRDGLSTSKMTSIGDVVKVLSILFSDVDVTFSDLLAGFLLASLYQRNLKAAGKNREHELTKVSRCVCSDCIIHSFLFRRR